MMGIAAAMSTLLQAMGLAPHWLKKPSEKPRIHGGDGAVAKGRIDAGIGVIPLRLFVHGRGVLSRR
jgi:hypothetical protein